MAGYIGAPTLVALIGLVLARVMILRRNGVEAMSFGKLDKADFLIPPFALFYIYLVFAAAFGFPTVSNQAFVRSEVLAAVGVIFCLAGLGLFSWSLLSFGRSFRVGIDAEHPDKLVTSGAFALTRNPIYVAFAVVLAGEFLIFPNWILLVYIGAAVWLFHRQVLREEQYLKTHYGKQYVEYSKRVKRYL